uniref:SSD domain-containing protein n=1 Tax=Parastrongyloides trichosuri TaxID=131310 RepID=A0A0N4ZB75_PARTI
MRPLEKIFYKYGLFISKYPAWFLIIPLIFTALTSIGFLKFHTQDDIWDIYAPINALSRVEERHLKDFEYPSSSHHYRIQVLVQHKNEGENLHNSKYLQEIQDINKLIVENITISDGLRNYFYHQLCGIYCEESNELLLAYLETIIELGGTETLNLKLTYPIGEAMQKQVFLGYSLGFVNYSEIEPNVVNGYRLFILYYIIDQNIPNSKIIIADFENKLTKWFASATKTSKNLKYDVLSKNRELEEQRKITLKSLPYLVITGGVLLIFMVVTLFDVPIYTSQHVEALFGVISPLMAIFTSFGLLAQLGYPFSNILTVVPFLVLTIGIDDAFLILAGWRQGSSLLTFPERIGEALSKSGASVTVTSITDVLCFAVGLFSNIPVVQLFCLYTSVALAIDFIYQLTFFTAIVVYCGKKQFRCRDVEKLKKTNIRKNNSSTSSSDGQISTKGSFLELLKRKPKIQESKLNIIMKKFVVFLHWPVTKYTTMFIFIFHLSITAYLCTKVTTEFNMENLYLRESPLTKIASTMQKFVLQESFVVNFGIENTPDFFIPEIKAVFDDMIRKLESIPKYSMGKKGTLLWTREYELLSEFVEEDEDFWSPKAIMKNFEDFRLDKKYIKTKVTSRGDEYISSFWWQISYHNMKNFMEVEELLEMRRGILKRYSNLFNVSSHHPLEKVPTESAASAPINFIQTAVSAVILMSLLVLLFVYDIGAIFSVVLSILSISGGTVAYLHLWDVHLDAVSLISILLSIGFSVDYSAHICYHYFTHVEEELCEKDVKCSQNSINLECKVTQESLKLPSNYFVGSESNISKGSTSTYLKIESTFTGVGWPVIQSGLSTVIGMIPLVFVHAYIVDVFWKTIVLVTALGLFHALFLLPVLFLIVEDISKLRKSRKNTVIDSNNH